MKKRINFKLTILSLLIMAFTVSGLASAAGQELQVKDLTPWIGEHEPYVNLFQAPGAVKFFAEVAKYAPGYTPEMVGKYFESMYGLKFTEMRIPDGKTVIFNKKIKGEYSYLGKLETAWGEYAITWYIFKTEAKEAIGAGYQYLLLMPYHAEGEGMPHCHLRYGNEDFAFLSMDPSLENWWPTLFKSEEVSKEAVLSQMKKDAKKYASMLPPIE